METAQALNLLMSSGSSEADRETRVARCGGCVLRAKLCVARCVTLRAMLRIMRHVLLRVRLCVVFASAGGVVRVRLWRWLLALPELCARIQAKAQTARDSLALFLLVACARSLRSATSWASLPELLMSYATRRTHKESRVPPRSRRNPTTKMLVLPRLCRARLGSLARRKHPPARANPDDTTIAVCSAEPS